VKYLILLLFLVSCVDKEKSPEPDYDYLIQAFGKSYVCEKIDYYSYGQDLKDCVNVLDSTDKIETILNASNFTAVGDLI
jgi:hypothetical protein